MAVVASSPQRAVAELIPLMVVDSYLRLDSKNCFDENWFALGWMVALRRLGKWDSRDADQFLFC